MGRGDHGGAYATPHIDFVLRKRRAPEQMPHTGHELLRVRRIEEFYRFERLLKVRDQCLHRFAARRPPAWVAACTYRAAVARTNAWRVGQARGDRQGGDCHRTRRIQQRVAHLPGSKLQRLGNVERAVGRICRNMADPVSQCDLGIRQPRSLGAHDDGDARVGMAGQV